MSDGLGRDVFARFKEDGPASKQTRDYLDRLLGRTPLRDPLPEDMPAAERMKHYARIGFDQYHVGAAEEFERAWAEAFPEEKGGRK